MADNGQSGAYGTCGGRGLPVTRSRLLRVVVRAE
jgi:hypothetical protein